MSKNDGNTAGKLWDKAVEELETTPELAVLQGITKESRAKRLARLKEEIEAGTYNPNMEAVAGAFLKALQG